MRRLLLAACLVVALPAAAHVGERPSIHDTVAMIKERMLRSLDGSELMALDAEKALAFLTPEERVILGTGYLSFDVNMPVMVYVLRDKGQATTPFWLAEQGFQPSAWEVKTDRRAYEVWYAPFEAGRVGLGISTIDGGGSAYFVGVAPQQAGRAPAVTDMYPGRHWLTEFSVGAKVYADAGDAIEAMPPELEGVILVQGLDRREDEGQLLNIFRFTGHPSSATPDQIVLTWHDDPKTTQAVQWRTDTTVDTGVVELREAGREAVTQGTASHTVMTDPELANDAAVHRWTAVLTGLSPDTAYEYRVGTGVAWSDWMPFETAPAGVRSFSFNYMGDAQNGLDTWGRLLHKAHDHRPDAEFYIMAGDLVNRGNERDDWDDFFDNAEGVFDRKQLVPCIGNHENQGTNGPWMYLQQFHLPANGPTTITPERAFAFEYSNAIFIILDTNLSVGEQLEWLEEQLANTKATWKFVVYHHPAYSSGERRDNPRVREIWGAVFDKYGVDLALQGHDHAYLRTYPMRGGERVDSPAEGTIYIVSVSGTKFYEQGDFDYTEVGFTNRATYQILDIRVEGNRLEYVAYDIHGEVADQFVIEK